MLKYIYIGLISLLLAGVLNSCYEDKGNYSYNWVQDIDLTEVLKDTTVGRGHVLYLEVDLKKQVLGTEGKTEVANPEDYTFEWKVITNDGDVVLSTEKDLNETIDLASGVSYQVNYTVTEKKMGVSWITDFKLNVVEELKGGFIFMTEDADRKVNIEIYADDTEGNKVHRTGLLSGSGFPYLSGGANSIVYTNVKNWGGKRLWVATGEATGWLNMPDFSWEEKNMLRMIMLTPQPVGYTMKSMYYLTDQFMYFFTGEGNVHLLTSRSILSADVTYVNNKKFNAAPYYGGASRDAAILFDQDRGRFVSYAMKSGGFVTESCYDMNDESALPNSDLLYMQRVTNEGTVAIVKDEDGKYQRCQFSIEENPTGTFKGHLDQMEELKGNAAMIEGAEYTVIDWMNGFLYFSIGNKLYTYRKGIDECVEVNVPDVSFDAIVSLNIVTSGDYSSNIFVATYSEANGGKVYRLTPESTDSRNLTVEEVIDTEGAVKCITYW